MIESFLVVSLDMVEAESLLIVVESVLIVEVVSVTVALDSVDSFFVLEQPDAKAKIESRKNADFFMSKMNLSQVDDCFYPLMRCY